jgi:hypothetical protein
MNNSYLDNPIFICGHRKTGTTLLINLFDCVSDTVVYPDDSGFFYMYYPSWDKNIYSDQDKINQIADQIIMKNLTSVIKRTKCSEVEQEELLEKQKMFYSLMKKCPTSELSTKSLFKYFIKSFQKTFYSELSNPRAWIEKTTSTEIYALDIFEWFPNAKFIHLIRDPRDNWASLKSGWEKRYKGANDDIRRLMHSLLERGKLGMEYAKHNKETIGEASYKVIKYEDLTANPEKTMKELAEFTGINFTEKLLKSSTFGFLWEGNNFEGVKNSSPSSGNVNRWKERIDDDEAMLIEYYFKDIMRYHGYETEFSLREQQIAATEHYKWYNFSTPYSFK